MSWRTIVITKKAKLSYKNNYMIVRGDEVNMIHLSEIHTILIDTTAASITSYLLCELMKRKVKVIFCDEKRNPTSELIPYYGSHNTSKRINLQINWDEHYKKLIWTHIIRQKIINQSNLLKKLNKKEYKKLLQYANEIKLFDITNREGHSAKVYFNSLFGMDFSRDLSNDINYALDYGYTLLLSTFNKEIVSKGYLTQIGIKHINEFNQFNLTSDLMEPFRVLIDEIVYKNIDKEFDVNYKMELINLLNNRIIINGREQFLTNAIPIYLKGVFSAIEKKMVDKLVLYEFI
jgi:CRISPR-associated endonuclease Cas1 subtype II